MFDFFLVVALTTKSLVAILDKPRVRQHNVTGGACEAVGMPVEVDCLDHATVYKVLFYLINNLDELYACFNNNNNSLFTAAAATRRKKQLKVVLAVFAIFKLFM